LKKKKMRKDTGKFEKNKTLERRKKRKNKTQENNKK